MADLLSKTKLSIFRKLQRKKYRELENRFIIEGWHLLEEAMGAGVKLHAVIWEKSRHLSNDDQRVLDKAIEYSEEQFLASEAQMKALGETKTSAGVIGIVDRLKDDWDSLEVCVKEEKRGFIVVLDAVSDPGNCGSIIRGSGWFGVNAVVLGKGCPDKENGKLVRATMGGCFTLPVVTVDHLEDCLGRLKSYGYRIVVSIIDAPESLLDFEWPEKTVLVVGNEARGVSQKILDLADFSIEIPKFGKGESLNAAMATSVFLSHWRIKN